jgi:glucuronate isomerase
MFLNPNFLLDSKWAELLYHDYASRMPIIDYHCHLNPKEIFENKQFTDLTQLWLFDQGAGDHYKWRLMRAAGQKEKNITGDGAPYEKFLAFVSTIERAMGRRNLEACQCKAAAGRFPGQRADEKNECRAGLHHRRSG